MTLLLLHNKHVAVYQGREQKAIYETAGATAEELELLRLEWEASKK